MNQDRPDKTYVVLVDQARRNRAHAAIEAAPEGWIVRIEEPTRSLEQNAAQWPILQAFSDQQEWIVNGVLTKMSPDEWKDVLSAAFDNETVRAALGLNGGIVMLGKRTSQFGKKRFSDWLEFLHYVAADRGVTLEQQHYEQNEH